MSTETDPPLSHDAHDERVNPPPETVAFDRVLARRMSRREAIGGAASSLGVLWGVSAFLTSAAAPGRAAATEAGMAFEPVPANDHDRVTLPPGYEQEVLVRWGDPLWSHGAPFDERTRGDSISQRLAFGDMCDGMELFERDGRRVLAVNNEYCSLDTLFGHRRDMRPMTADDILKDKMAHGVSLVEIVEEEEGGRWRVALDSPLNRRVTPDDETELRGPARGHPLLRTADDPSGTRSLGTWANCGSGRTPWGTYLTCEENFNGYFQSSTPRFERTKAMRRYGLSEVGYGHRWALIDPRFDLSRHPNEPNRAGYVVEIDPFDPGARPIKRTALGRFKHENAALTLAADGRVVVYLGDDERGEFLYRYVSRGTYAPGDGAGDLLDEGELSVARFEESGRGAWVPLTPGATGMSAAEICIHTRLAASAVGATTMDRPEWVAVHPGEPQAYCALTKNENRGLLPNRGGDPTPVGGPNPRMANLFGQILRWRPDGGDHAAPEFDWDLFALAGNPRRYREGPYRGSPNITKENMFNAPDGLSFDSRGLLWIRTDGDYEGEERPFRGMGNNQMLAGDPATGEIKRFLVGPRQCEIAGVAWSPDRRTMFVAIQHPGEKGGDSRYPDGGLPRSTVIQVRRTDGGPIG